MCQIRLFWEAKLLLSMWQDTAWEIKIALPGAQVVGSEYKCGHWDFRMVLGFKVEIQFIQNKIIFKNFKYHWNKKKKNILIEILKSYLNISEDIHCLQLGTAVFLQRWFRCLGHFTWQTGRSPGQGNRLKAGKSVRQGILNTNSDYSQVGGDGWGILQWILCAPCRSPV